MWIGYETSLALELDHRLVVPAIRAGTRRGERRLINKGTPYDWR